MREWRFFPVRGVTAADPKDAKKPALEGDWQGHSTADPATLDAWRAQGYALALDCENSGVAVVDLDPGSKRPDHLPETYTRNTPRGGFHLIYDDPDSLCRTTQGEYGLGPHIDTRGRGGYIVYEGPGYSEAEGTSRTVAKLPGWVPEKLAEKSDTKAAAKEGVELDTPEGITRAREWLSQQPPAVEGEGGNDRTYRTAAALLDLVTEEAALDLLVGWNRTCVPPWDHDELAAIVEHALSYRQNDVGAWALPPRLSSFGDTLTRLGLDAKPGREKPPRFYAFSVEEQDGFKDPVMLVPDFLPAESVAMLYAEPGSYKSFIALDFALNLSAGLDGWSYKGPEEAVVYVAGEGGRSVARLRRPAWEREHGVDYDYPFHLVTQMPIAADPEDVRAFIAQVKAQGLHPKVVVLDTLARFMLGLNENDVKDAQGAVSALEYIRDELRCSVLVVHHTGKEAGRGPRGSSALGGGFDTLHEITAHKATHAVMVKHKLAKDGEERAEPWCFEGHKVAGSLVFRPIAHSQFKSLSTQDDGLGPKRIQEVLVHLKALQPPGVTTRTLATELYKGPPDESEADMLEHIRLVEVKLHAAAKGRLAALCDRVGRELRWFIAS